MLKMSIVHLYILLSKDYAVHEKEGKYMEMLERRRCRDGPRRQQLERDDVDVTVRAEKQEGQT